MVRHRSQARAEAWLWALFAAAAVWAYAGTVPATAAAALRPLAVKHSLLGTHRWYAQTHRGLDVVDGYVAVHEYRDGHIETAEGRRLVRGDVAARPAVAKSRAADIARRAAHASRTASEPALAILPGTSARLVWSVMVVRATGHERVLVDASSGEVRRIDRLAVDATGSGRVFDPNPVVTLRDPTLEDQDDADYPALAGAYKQVQLEQLDGSGFLRGAYATIALPQADAAFEPQLSFDFARSSPFFEQTMAYYHVTRAQEYIQSLGFSDLNDEPQRLLPNLVDFDNSFFDPSGDEIVFGTGGVDDAEDADIIWHEYGHALQSDQVELPFPGSADTAAIGEGFGDYWAATMSQAVNDGYDVPCVGDWNAVESAGPARRCLRRVDEDLTVADRTGEPHDDGRIWARALWDCNQALGRDLANRIVLEAQFAYAPTMTFSQAAAVTVSTAKRLYGQATAKVVAGAFAARGIGLRDPPAKPPRPYRPLSAEVVATIGEPAPGGGTLDDAFEPGGLNLGGAVSFNADLLVGGEPIGEGAFLADGGQISELARAGGAAPGGGLYGPGTLGPVVLNDDGAIAFGFLLDPLGSPFGMNTALYRRAAGATASQALVSPDSTPAPGGGTFRGAFEAAIDTGNQVAFTGLTDSDAGYVPGVGSGAYVAQPDGAITAVAAPGDPAPGGGNLDHAAGPAINAGGDVAFSAHVSSDPAFCLDGFLDCIASVFVRRAASGLTEAVARQEAPVPGGDGSRYFFALEPVLNDRGDVAYFAKLDPSLDNAIYLRSGGATQQIVRDLQTIPDVGTVLLEFPVFRGFAADYAVNNRRQVAFRTLLFDEQSEFGVVTAACIWDAGKVRLLARTGTSVPGVGTIDRIFQTVHLNERGQVLLHVDLTDGRRVLLRTR